MTVVRAYMGCGAGITREALLRYKEERSGKGTFFPHLFYRYTGILTSAALLNEQRLDSRNGSVRLKVRKRSNVGYVDADIVPVLFYKRTMYDARAVANFFIDRAQHQNVPLTVMTLLKVLYFAHAWYLAKFRTPLIGQPFEAWQYGPVNRVVYDQYKQLGKKKIEEKAKSFDPISLKFLPTAYEFDFETEKLLGDIFDYYSKFHPFRLSDLTHEKGGPWDTVWSEAQDRAVPGMIIPNDLILAWFQRSDAVDWTYREHRMSWQ